MASEITELLTAGRAKGATDTDRVSRATGMCTYPADELPVER